MDKAEAPSDKKAEFFLASSVSPSVVATEMIPAPAMLLSLEEVTFGGMVASATALSFWPGFCWR